MRVGIAAGHGGFDLRQELLVQLRAAGHEVADFGAHSLVPDDDFPEQPGVVVARNPENRS